MGSSAVSVDLVEAAYRPLYLGADTAFHMADVALTLYVISTLSWVASRVILSLSDGDWYKGRDNKRDNLQSANYGIPEMGCQHHRTGSRWAAFSD